METYNSVDLVVNGQRINSADVAVGVDWARGSDETAVALVERKPAGNYEIKWSMPINPREARRLMRRSARLCWKCRDGRTRAHHRLCSKRGGKVERWNSAWHSEAAAARTGQASPGRLRGVEATHAQVYGLWWRRYDEQAEKARRELSPLTASPDGLNRLAALYGVDRRDAAPVA